jgi:TolB protein
MIVPAEGGDPEILLHDEFDNRGMVWRPDNRRVVFESKRGATHRNLFEIDVVTRKITQLTFGTKDANGVSVSLDDRMVYAPFWHDQFLYVADIETGERVKITSHPMNSREARFAPDGRTVAYASNRTGNYEIWLHHRDGRPETRLTNHERDDRKPEWSPDGQRIVFASDRDGGTFKLFVANDGPSYQLGPGPAAVQQSAEPLVARRRFDRVSRPRARGTGALDGRTGRRGRAQTA